jgi:hypothetical protein
MHEEYLYPLKAEWNIACLPIGLCDHTVGVQSGRE